MCAAGLRGSDATVGPDWPDMTTPTHERPHSAFFSFFLFFNQTFIIIIIIIIIFHLSRWGP